MIDFLRAIEDRYLPETSNPYHNNIHAADVLQTTHSFLEMGSQYQLFDGGASPPTSAFTLQMFSLLVGAAIHDVGHPGYNNAFQSKTLSQIALTYNDNSILENYHTSLAFQMVLGENAINSEWNIFKNMIPGEFVQCKQFITEAILNTDMKFHFERCNEIKSLSIPTRKNNNLNDENDDDDDVKSKDTTNKKMAYSWNVLKFILHMADISNSAKRQSISIQWTDRVLEEFFRQGDKEREMGLLPISPLCDRNTTSRADSQMGFINFVIRPSFEVLQRHLPYTAEFLPLIQKNYKFWELEKKTEEEKNNNNKKTEEKDTINKEGEKEIKPGNIVTSMAA